jgi:hypothetical protein
MTTYTKPENLNGTELIAELLAVGIVINKVRDNGDDTITLETTDKKAGAIVASHNGTIVAPELTIEEKLQSVGLNLNDLKVALGI